jgi:membrane associated rhomboid family serine protease
VIPIRDDVPTQRRAVVVGFLVLVNVAVFAHELALQAGPGGPAALAAFVRRYGLVPRVLLSGGPQVWITPLSSMFLHGGLLHLGGNLLYLWIFGNNVEDLLGHARFAVFYLACGLVAAAAQVASAPASLLPTIGASGAISGVLGAYLVSYPTARVRTLIPLGFIWPTVLVPAVVFLVLWFVMQLFSGLATMGAERGGVAWWAHVGGFVAGAALARPMRQHAPTRARLSI